MSIPYYDQLAIQCIGAIMLSAFGYYAVRLLASFRKGMLERGWKLVMIGAVILALGQIPYIASVVTSSATPSLVFTLAGSVVRFVGVFLLILGFREQYKIWRVDDKKDKLKDVQTGSSPANTIER